MSSYLLSDFITVCLLLALVFLFFAPFVPKILVWWVKKIDKAFKDAGL